MKWSLEEITSDLIYLYSVCIGRWYHFYRIWKYPRCIYLQTKLFLVWLKTGYGYSSNWELDIVLSQIIYKRIDNLIRTEITVPLDLYDECEKNNLDPVKEFTKILEEIRDSFKEYSMIDEIDIIDKEKIKYYIKKYGRKYFFAINDSLFDEEDQIDYDRRFKEYTEKIKTINARFDNAKKLFIKYFESLNN